MKQMLKVESNHSSHKLRDKHVQLYHEIIGSFWFTLKSDFLNYF